MADLLRERIFAIACGYPDGNDLDDLRKDPAFKMACGRLPENGLAMASQPTLSRLENTPDLRDLIRLSWGMVDLWCKPFLHHSKITVYDRTEDQKVTTVTVVHDGVSATHLSPSDEVANPSPRRHGVAIAFACETCGEGIELTISQHKGNSNLAWRFAAREQAI